VNVQGLALILPPKLALSVPGIVSWTGREQPDLYRAGQHEFNRLECGGGSHLTEQFLPVHQQPAWGAASFFELCSPDQPPTTAQIHAGMAPHWRDSAG